MTFPDITDDLKARLPDLKGRPVRQRAACRHHLVSRRRPGAGAVRARRRGRSRLLSRRRAGRPAGDGGRARVQSSGARRRHAGRGDQAGPRLRLGNRRGGASPARRHRDARREGGACRRRCGHRRAGVLPRHPRLDRRGVAHERRRTRSRDQGRARGGARCRPPGAHPHALARRHGLYIPAQQSAATISS